MIIRIRKWAWLENSFDFVFSRFNSWLSKPSCLFVKVSQGAEVLMLNMEYFLRYSDDEVRDNVRSIMQVYPHDMQRRLQNEADWTSFKNETLNLLFSKSKKY